MQLERKAQSSLNRSHSKGLAPPIPLTGEIKNLIEAAQRLLCEQRELALNNRVFETLGRVYMTTKHWEEAAVAFHQSANVPVDQLPEAQLRSALMSLDALNAAGSQRSDDERTACDATARAWAREARSLCPPSRQDTEDCTLLTHTLESIDSKAPAP